MGRRPFLRSHDNLEFFGKKHDCKTYLIMFSRKISKSMWTMPLFLHWDNFFLNLVKSNWNQISVWYKIIPKRFFCVYIRATGLLVHFSFQPPKVFWFKKKTNGAMPYNFWIFSPLRNSLPLSLNIFLGVLNITTQLRNIPLITVAGILLRITDS